MAQQQPSEKLTLAEKCRRLWAIFSGRDAQARQVFIDYHLIRRKYVLSRVSEHYGIDKFEPAPLLNKNLLDVGCGTNRIAQELALRGANCLAIDTSHEVVSKAKESAEKYGAPVVFVQGAAENLVQDTARYDVILCLDVIEDTENPDKLLWAMKKMLKPDGILVFSTTIHAPASWLFHKVMAEWVLRWRPRGSYKGRKVLKRKNFLKLFEKHGFGVTRKTGVAFCPFTHDWYKSENENLRLMGVAVHKN